MMNEKDFSFTDLRVVAIISFVFGALFILVLLILTNEISVDKVALDAACERIAGEGYEYSGDGGDNTFLCEKDGNVVVEERNQPKVVIR